MLKKLALVTCVQNNLFIKLHNNIIRLIFIIKKVIIFHEKENRSKQI